MPIVAWKPGLEWRGYDLVCNGAELAVADFPELFAALFRGPSPTFCLPDYPNSIVRAIPAGPYPIGAMASFDPSIVGPWPPDLPIEELSAVLVGPRRHPGRKMEP
jgi:Phage Tail Collar Domain